MGGGKREREIVRDGGIERENGKERERKNGKRKSINHILNGVHNVRLK